jgi:hypothetical protein
MFPVASATGTYIIFLPLLGFRLFSLVLPGSFTPCVHFSFVLHVGKIFMSVWRSLLICLRPQTTRILRIFRWPSPVFRALATPTPPPLAPLLLLLLFFSAPCYSYCASFPNLIRLMPFLRKNKKYKQTTKFNIFAFPSKHHGSSKTAPRRR